MTLRLDRDTLLMVGFHLLPLLGVWFLGWNAHTLLILYWLETLAIGFWTVVLVAVSRDQAIGLLSSATQPSRTGFGMALFVAVHAGFFMAIHMVFLHAVFGIGTVAGGEDVLETLTRLLVGGGLWLPLAGIFLIRGLVTFDALRREDRVDRYLVGFYFRIVVMQFAIIGGGFLLLLFGTQGPLLVLVAVRIGFELAVPSVEDYVEAQVVKAQAGTKPPPA